MHSVLMIAFHYPPVQGSSGLQRTLAYSRHLQEHGWQPLILTAHPRAYERRCDAQLHQIPPDVPVTRAFALDAARHLGLRRRYFKWTAIPDRWATWWAGGVLQGLRLIARYRPEVIWSTYPIATAHLIALTLERFTGLPWVADFRDGMTGVDYPADATKRRSYSWIERRTVERAARVVFAAPGTARIYAGRYPWMANEQLSVIANGYDEADFAEAEHLPVVPRASPSMITLVHSGLLNSVERDPSAFLAALAAFQQRRILRLRVVFRGTGHNQQYRAMVHAHGLGDVVHVEEPLPYREALAEMLQADGLLLFQGSRCNHLIPAKVYEYLRAGRPILALIDPSGDTAQLLAHAGVGTIAHMDSSEEIAQVLPQFLADLTSDGARRPAPAEVRSHSREVRTAELAGLLDAVRAGRVKSAAAEQFDGVSFRRR